MITLAEWIDMGLKQIHKQVDTCVDLFNLNEIDPMLKQARKLRRTTDLFVRYIERNRKLG